MSSSLDTRFSRARLKDSPVVSRFVFCRPQDDLIKITVINEYACKRPPPSVSSQKRFSSNMPHAGISRSKAKTQTGTSFSNNELGNERRFHASTEAYSGTYSNTPSVRLPGSGRGSQHRGQRLGGWTHPSSTCSNIGFSSAPQAIDSRFSRRGGPGTQAASLPAQRILRDTALTRQNGTFAEPNTLYQSDAFRPNCGARRPVFDRPSFATEFYRGDGRKGKNKSFSRGSRRPSYWQHDDRRDNKQTVYTSHTWRSGPLMDKSGFVHASIADEYIDDFTPEDLNKYKLDVNMGRHRRQAQNFSSMVRGRPTAVTKNGAKTTVTPDHAGENRIADTKQLDRTHYTNEHPEQQRYLTPAFQFWSDSGLGDSPRLRHASLGGDESERNSIRLQLLSKLYGRKSWPCLFLSLPRLSTSLNESHQLFRDPASCLLSFRSCPLLVASSNLQSSKTPLRRYCSASMLSPDISFLYNGDSGLDAASGKSK